MTPASSADDDAAPARPRFPAEAAGAGALLLAALAALIWANSPWQASYRDLWATDLSLGLRLDLHQWVNDGLMAVFFLVVGLEIKREALTGALRDRRTAMLPVLAAAGGMIVPALVFLTVTTAAGAGMGHGWAIPMATDIAFAVSVLALAGPAAPGSLRLFLLTLAVVDDLGAILVIALFYTARLRPGYLVAAIVVVLAILVVQRTGVAWTPVYAVLGLGLWWAVHGSGVHATVAGVTLGLLTPGSHLRRLEDRLRPWTTFVVLPVFALANAGVHVRTDAFRAPGALAVFAGVGAGLAVGKVVGITGAARLAVSTRLASRPHGASWPSVAAVATVGGIGFTVSLFIAELAFPPGAVQDAARLGVLGGSTVAGAAGALALRLVGRRR